MILLCFVTDMKCSVKVLVATLCYVTHLKHIFVRMYTL